jgi:hypothetical protein
VRIGSLCSGYGGLELGVQAVYGGTTAWVSDIDKGACKILAHRFPGVPNVGDMTAVDWAAVEPVDLICGGTPCQDLSHAGKRAGMTEGTRSNLWVAMREAIAVIRPRYVVWENVRGAYSACADSDLGRCPRCVDPSHPGGHAPFSVPSVAYSATFPTSGMTRAGTAFALPTSVAVTPASESSSLLPTPSVSDSTGGHLNRSGDRSGELLLPGVAKLLSSQHRP